MRNCLGRSPTNSDTPYCSALKHKRVYLLAITIRIEGVPPSDGSMVAKSNPADGDGNHLGHTRFAQLEKLYTRRRPSRDGDTKY